MHRAAMVIDDSAMERFLAERVIRNAMFADEVICFNSPLEGLAYLNTLGNDPARFPDVLFVDIHMPLMNGFQFLDEFQHFSNEIKQHCKIVMCSSSIATEDEVRIQKYPTVSKFLTKPLSVEMLENLRAV